MKKDLKDLWVTELLSGNYRQTNGNLHVVDGDQSYFCCLGVFCKIAEKMGVVEGRRVGDDYGTTNVIVYGPPGHNSESEDVIQDAQTAFLPQVVMDWAKLVEDRDILWELAVANDNGDSFAEIAEMIKEKL